VTTAETRKDSVSVFVCRKGDEPDHHNFRGISVLLMSDNIVSNIPLPSLTPYLGEINGGCLVQGRWVHSEKLTV
jgi:hypothetical protein